jgi:aminomethyltransferase
MLIVNAACKEADEAHLRKHLSAACDIEVLDRALIAVQGPGAARALGVLAPLCASMRFMDVASLTVVGAEYIVSRSGYTGEDGYEISMPRDHAEHAVRALLAIDGIAPIGLGYFIRAEVLQRRREKAAKDAASARPDAPVTTEAKLADRYGRRR